jgi:polyribonucleotide nucleotidyltransferase
VKFHLPRSWLLGWFGTPSVSWTDANGTQYSDRLQVGTTLGIKAAGQPVVAQVPVEHIMAVRFGWRDQSYYDAVKPPLDSYKPGTVYQGTVAGIQEFGIFVNLDGHRDGLVHVSKLPGRSPGQYQRGDRVTVVVVKTEVHNGKEKIELDLQHK